MLWSLIKLVITLIIIPYIITFTYLLIINLWRIDPLKFIILALTSILYKTINLIIRPSFKEWLILYVKPNTRQYVINLLPIISARTCFIIIILILWYIYLTISKSRGKSNNLVNNIRIRPTIFTFIYMAPLSIIILLTMFPIVNYIEENELYYIYQTIFVNIYVFIVGYLGWDIAFEDQDFIKEFVYATTVGGWLGILTYTLFEDPAACSIFAIIMGLSWAIWLSHKSFVINKTILILLIISFRSLIAAGIWAYISIPYNISSIWIHVIFWISLGRITFITLLANHNNQFKF